MPKHKGLRPMKREGGAKTMRVRRGLRFAAVLVLLAGAGLTGLSFVATSATAATVPVSQATVTTTPNGTVTSTATCTGTDTNYTVDVSATGIKSTYGTNAGNIWHGGVAISDGVSTVYTNLVYTDANGDVTLPSFAFDSGGSTSVQLYIESTTYSGGVDLGFNTNFPDCTPGGTTSGLTGFLGCPNTGGTSGATVLVSGSISHLPASSLLSFGVHDQATNASGSSTVSTDGSGDLTLANEIIDTSSSAYNSGDTADWDLRDQNNNVQASGSFVISANQCANPTPGGTASGTATCNPDGTYAVVVEVEDVVSSDPAHNDPSTGYASVGLQVVGSFNNVWAGPIGTKGQQTAAFGTFNFDARGAASAEFTVTTLRNVGVADMPFTVTFPSCSPPPPVLIPVTPAPPTATTSNCTNQSETVTPSSQTGVVWSPAGSTVLKVGESVTYTATPDHGYQFPVAAQTSWTFKNTFDASKCTPPPPPPVASAPTVTLNASQATPMAMQAVSSSVTVSGSATLSWNSTGATSLTASGEWSGQKSVPSGTETVTPSGPGTYTYTLTASGPGGTASASVTVVVAAATTTPAPSPSPTHTGAPTSPAPTSPATTPGSPTPVSSQSQVGPVPHTGFTGTFQTLVSYPYGWARVPGIVLFATGLLFGGVMVLKRREATQR